MIRGPKFRGISYKCGSSYFTEKQWPRAIKELESIPSFIEDELICEMLGACYLNIGDDKRAKELYIRAADIYSELGNLDKKQRLNEKVETISKGM
jgi:tetratricopeptide (TPR) repeat protein